MTVYNDGMKGFSSKEHAEDATIRWVKQWIDENLPESPRSWKPPVLHRYFCDHRFAVIPDRWILRPRRHQSPFHELGLVAVAVTDNHRHRLRWRDVVAGRKWKIALNIPAVFDLAKFECCGKSATHNEHRIFHRLDCCIVVWVRLSQSSRKSL